MNAVWFTKTDGSVIVINPENVTYVESFSNNRTEEQARRNLASQVMVYFSGGERPSTYVSGTMEEVVAKLTGVVPTGLIPATAALPG